MMKHRNSLSVVAALLVFWGCGDKDYESLAPRVESISLSAAELTVHAEESIRIIVGFAPTGSSSRVAFSSSDETVLSVSGEVRALSAGTATIRVSATDDSGVYSSCAVKVTDSSSGGDDPGPIADEDPAADPRLTMFYNCDSMDGVTQNPKHRTGMTVETVGRMEGKGFLSRTCSTDAEIFIITLTDPVNAKISDKSKGHLAFWFYVDDAAKLRKNSASSDRIEISSGGSPSRRCLYWGSKEYISDKVIDGWNYINLPFSKGTEVSADDPFNPVAANYLRIYFDGPVASLEMTYGLDSVGFYEE